MLQLPSSQQEWLRYEKEFQETWNFPHCLAAVDGKHIEIQAPWDSGSEYYNYKSFFSIVLFALVDANYNFMFADVGAQGRISDGGIFKNCALWKKIEGKTLNAPQPKALPGREKRVPYVFLGDEAFALHENFLKPYSGVSQNGSKERIFNYRLSRARRVTENSFGILSAVFRVLRKPMLLEAEKVRDVVLTTLFLHNFLRRSETSRDIYTPPGTFDNELPNGTVIEGNWRKEILGTALRGMRKKARKSSEVAKAVRNEFAEYFVTTGQVSWQESYA